jgi:hypothetical protein
VVFFDCVIVENLSLDFHHVLHEGLGVHVAGGSIVRNAERVEQRVLGPIKLISFGTNE